MDKKTLIGVSICAVVLLVLGSLSNVVGYQSVKSTTVNDSPLFQTRTQRATNKQQNNLTSQYLGMGKENLLQFPLRDNRTEQLKKAIDIISKMDDKTFHMFLVKMKNLISQQGKIKNIDLNDIEQVLYELRNNSMAFQSNIGDLTIDTPTLCLTMCFFIICFLSYFIIIMVMLYAMIFTFTGVVQCSITTNCQ